MAYSQSVAAIQDTQRSSVTEARRKEKNQQLAQSKSSSSIANRLIRTIQLADTSVLNKKDQEMQILPLLKDNPKYVKPNRLT